MTKDEIKAWLKEKLSKKLYDHSLGTQEMSERLAEIYNVDREKASLAGLIHDCAKELPKKILLKYAELNGIAIDQVTRLHPGLLHAPVSAIIAKEEFGIKDEGILHAVAVHSIGSKGMSDLDKIVYVSDSAEINRAYPEVEEIRSFAFDGKLDEAMLKAIEVKLIYVMKKRHIIHPTSVDVRNEILMRLKFNTIGS